MKLSVIVPVYNLESFIGPCLESLVTQKTDFDFEILVANDCSTDNSLEVIQAYQVRFPHLIKVIKQNTNQRLAANMKSLLEKACGEYIAYLDGDDLALSGKLQAQVDFLDVNPECGLVYHESEVFDSETNQVSSHYVRDYYNRKFIPDVADITHLVRYGSFFQASSLMFRRHDHLQEAVDDKCKIILDQPFQILNAGFTEGSIGRIEKVLGRYRIHANSFGAQTLQDYSRRERVLADQLQAISNGHKFGVPEDTINQGAAHYYMATAMYFLKLGEVNKFSHYIGLSAQTDWRFDDRHAFLVAHQDDVQVCKQVFN